MSDRVLGPGPRTRVRRLPTKAAYDSATVEAILDEARFCHVAAIVEGRALTLPTLYAREGRTLYLHGSQSNALMKAVVETGEVCLSAVIYDGLRLARSGFESSIAYRSVVVFGTAEVVLDETEKRRVLDLFVDATLPGRAAEVRAMTDQELRLTMVVRVRVDEASSAGPTEDDADDVELAIWSGTVPARLAFGAPVPSSDGAMASGTIEVPASIRRLTKETS
jgi:nitroimidazol reductase NimA-like FMN-containing flavoprotein (pyridoxamine 5'-phosphate oxidase superfamily)